MKYFYAIDVQIKYATCLFVKKDKKSFNVIEHQSLELDDLSEFLKDKKSYYLSIEQDEIIDEKISIESIIKNDNVIKSLITRKLHETNPKDEILFNYHSLPKNENDEKTTYQIDGVHEKTYLKSLEVIKNKNEIKSATIHKLSLFGISRECIKEGSYFSIHTHANRITLIAVHDNAIIFSRVNAILADNAETRKINLVEEITQTISYVQQQFREINFSVVALSGSIAIDDIITEHIFMSCGISITVLYPNTFIKGLEAEEAQHYMFSLGSFLVPKKAQFMPKFILALKQYNLFSKILLAASVIAVMLSSFFVYEKLDSYFDSLQKYETVKSKLNNIVKSTTTYSNEKLAISLKYLKIAERHLQHHPSDTIFSLKPLVEMQRPQGLQWQYIDDSLKLSTTFKRSFNSLKELYMFEKLFFSRFEDINSTFKKEHIVRSDYEKLDFDITVVIENVKEEEAIMEPVRRRR